MTLGGTAVVVEHVGSTAVPGLRAKPIIDIDLGIPDSWGRVRLRARAGGGRLRARIREPDWHQHRLFGRRDGRRASRRWRRRRVDQRHAPTDDVGSSGSGRSVHRLATLGSVRAGSDRRGRAGGVVFNNLGWGEITTLFVICLLYTSDAADE